LHNILHNEDVHNDDSAITTINNLLARPDISQEFAEALNSLKSQHKKPIGWFQRFFRWW